MILARKIRAVATGYFKSIFGRALDILLSSSSEEHQRVNAHLRAHPYHPGPTRFEPSPTSAPTRFDLSATCLPQPELPPGIPVLALRHAYAADGGVDSKLCPTPRARLSTPAPSFAPVLFCYPGPPRYRTCQARAPFARSALTNAPRTSRVFFLSSSQCARLAPLLLPAAACAYCVDSPHRRVACALLLLAAALACLARLSLLRAGIADAGLVIRALAGVRLLPLPWDGSIPAM
ncbi:hypothetical protein C8J57DRAFT_1718520 [Mycena rebaudengoi]|nr:hypothetical protein C8J57DRAFT_1718520 [Mycena rebaudengoi]